MEAAPVTGDGSKKPGATGLDDCSDDQLKMVAAALCVADASQRAGLS